MTTSAFADPTPPTAFPCRVVAEPERVWQRIRSWQRLLAPPGCWLWGGEVRDAHRLPPGPVIVVANHLSAFDTLLLGWAMPRVAAYLAKAEILDWPIVGTEAIRCGGFPARRGRGDPTAFLTAVSVLDAGHPVVLHPEGSRSLNGLYGTQRLRAGAARFALARPVPIQPIALFGTDSILPKHGLIPGRGRCSAQFGEPIYPEAYLPPADWPVTEQVTAINAVIDRAFRTLLPTDLQTETPTPGLERVPVGTA